MELEISKLIFDYSINNKMPDEKYLDNLVEIAVNGKTLHDYVKEVIWNEKLVIEGGFIKVANYDIRDKKLQLNFPSFERALKQFYEERTLFPKKEKPFHQNSKLSKIVLHEIEHAAQKKEIEIGPDSLERNLLSASIPFSPQLNEITFQDQVFRGEISKMESLFNILEVKAQYMEYYHQIPSERIAQIRANETINKSLKHIEKYAPYLQELERISLLEEKLKGYEVTQETKKISCPTEVYLIKTGISNIKLWKNFDFFDSNSDKMLKKVKSQYNLEQRLLYGLPVSYEEYKKASEKLQSIKKSQGKTLKIID